MFERFTERARRVVLHAQKEAARLRHNVIGTEHLLLGLVKEGDGVAAKALEMLSVDLNKVRHEVEKIIGIGEDMVFGEIPFTRGRNGYWSWLGMRAARWATVTSGRSISFWG